MSKNDIDDLEELSVSWEEPLIDDSPKSVDWDVPLDVFLDGDLNEEDKNLRRLGIYSTDERVNNFIKEIYNEIPQFPENVIFDISFCEYMIESKLKGRKVNDVLSPIAERIQKMEYGDVLKLFQYEGDIENMPFLNLGLTYIEKIYLIAHYIEKFTEKRNEAIVINGKIVQVGNNDLLQTLIARLFSVNFNDGQCKLNIQRMGIEERDVLAFLFVFPGIRKIICNYKDKQGNLILNSIVSNKSLKKRIIMENATIDSIYLLIESNEFSDEDLVDIIFNVHIDLDNFVENCSLLDDRPRLKEMIEKRREAFRKLADSRGNLSSKSIIEIPNNMFVGVELEYYGAPQTSIAGFQSHYEKTIISAEFTDGNEVVSPKLNHETVNDVLEVADLLKAAGGRTNDSCAIHVHIDSKYFDVYDENGNFDFEATKIVWKNFLEMWASCERNLYSVVNKAGECSRDLLYAMPMAESIEYIIAQGIMDKSDIGSFKYFIRNYQAIYAKEADPRYFSVNFSNLCRTEEDVEKQDKFKEKHTGKDTIEFRLANGTLDSREIALTIQLYTRFMELSKELGLIEIKLTRGEKLSEDEKNKWNIRSQILENQELSRDNKFSFMLDLLFAEDSIRSQYEERYEQNKYDQVVAQVYGEVLEQDVEGRGGNEKLSDEKKTDGVDVDDLKKLAEETIVTNPMGIPNVIEQIKGVFKGVRDKFLR